MAFLPARTRPVQWARRLYHRRGRRTRASAPTPPVYNTPANPRGGRRWTSRLALREGVRAVCERYATPRRALDVERGYPEEFIAELGREGWLSTMIPKELGGGGMGLAERASCWRR